MFNMLRPTRVLLASMMTVLSLSLKAGPQTEPRER